MDRNSDRIDTRTHEVGDLGDVRRAGPRGTGQALLHLDELDDYKVADGEPDIRGWTVRTSDGRKIGKVDDLLVDLNAMKVRYIEVELDRKALSLDEDRHVLVAIGNARLNDDDDVVVVSRASTEVAALPAYTRGAMSADAERSLRERYVGAPAARTAAAGSLYDDEHFDDRSFFGSRRGGREGAEYLTRSEEELAVGKRAVEAGTVTARKTVETEHVRESVPVVRETATVERRPIREGAAAAGDMTIGEDEVRVPLMAEEVVTQKRVVPKEEVVIRKQQVQGRETVEADLKRERIDVDRPTTDRSDDATRDRR